MKRLAAASALDGNARHHRLTVFGRDQRSRVLIVSRLSATPPLRSGFGRHTLGVRVDGRGRDRRVLRSRPTIGQLRTEVANLGLEVVDLGEESENKGTNRRRHLGIEFDWDRAGRRSRHAHSVA